MDHFCVLQSSFTAWPCNRNEVIGESVTAKTLDLHASKGKVHGGRHVNSGGAWGCHAPQCPENAIAVGKSLISLGIC